MVLVDWDYCGKDHLFIDVEDQTFCLPQKAPEETVEFYQLLFYFSEIPTFHSSTSSGSSGC